MPLQEPQVGWHSSRQIVLLVLLLILSLGAHAQYVHVAMAGEPGSEISLSILNFHMYSVVYSNSNSSIFVYNGVDTNPPTYATALTTVVSCRVRQSARIWFGEIDVWLGAVSWITQPLAEDMTIRGNVSITVWLSTPQRETVASGYAFGLSEVDSMGNPLGEPLYDYYYSYGNVLGSSPTPLKLAFNVDRTFMKGNIIGFFVIVGSTTEGWRYQVYFDSPSMNSFAEMPTLSVPVPEFSQMGLVATMGLAALCYYAIGRTKSRLARNSDHPYSQDPA